MHFVFCICIPFSTRYNQCTTSLDRVANSCTNTERCSCNDTRKTELDNHLRRYHIVLLLSTKCCNLLMCLWKKVDWCDRRSCVATLLQLVDQQQFVIFILYFLIAICILLFVFVFALLPDITGVIEEALPRPCCNSSTSSNL